MQRMIAAPDAPEHPRIAIFGPLEARLQRRDRMILASLNEGSWPKPAAADAFLNRTLRKQPRPARSRRAHRPLRARLRADGQCARSHPAARHAASTTSPPSPRAGSGACARSPPAALADAKQPKPPLTPAANADPLVWAARHAPCRQGDARKAARAHAARRCARDLDKFSPSRVVTLIRDPYADYARRILRLEPLRRVGEDVDARERGTAVHAAIEHFEKPDNETPIAALIEQELNKAGAAAELIALEMPLWERAGAAYLRWSAERAPRRADAVTEKKGSIKFDASIGAVELESHGRPHRTMTDGTLAIIDFKTGQPKKAPQVESGLEPQLALEAAIAARAQLRPLSARAPTSELIYFRMSISAETAKDKNGQPLEFENGTTRAGRRGRARRPQSADRPVCQSRPALLLQAARRIHLVRLRL